MKRKGVSGAMILSLVGLMVMGLIIVVTNGSASESVDYTRHQAVDLQAERVVNAMMVMETVPEGHLSLSMEEYQIKYDQNDNNLSLNFSGSVGSSQVEPYMISYDNIIAPSAYEPINGSLCVQKEYRSGQSTLILNESGCPT